MKNLANKIIITGLLLSICHISYAKVDEKKELREKVLALNLVKQYVKSIACETSFDSMKKDSSIRKRISPDVFTIQSPQIDEAYGERSKYYVLWQGNRGCEHANTPVVSEAYYVTEVVSSIGPMYTSKPLTIRVYDDNFEENNNQTLDDAFQFEKNDILSFTIKKITKISDGIFEIQHTAYDEKDISGSPTIPVKTILQFNDKKNEWHTISRKVDKNSEYSGESE